ncbi:MAG: hypothetical protein AAGC71_03390 [Pseudomonadota bacterium]
MSRSLLATALLLAPLAASADGAIGFKVSSLGLGLEGAWHLSDRWTLRAGAQTYDYAFDDEIDGVAYDGDLALESVTALADYRPWRGRFRLTAGAVYNNNQVIAVADPNATYTIGNTTYSQAEVGVLAADVAFDRVAPYAGLGVDIDLGGDWQLCFDLGAVYQGKPRPTLTSTGGVLSGDPQFVADLAREADNFRDDASDYDVYPVIAMGLSLAF